MKTVLITGAGGSLGSACTNHFAARGWRVLALVSPGKKPSTPVDHVRYEEADLLDEEGTGEVIGSLLNEFPNLDLAILTVGGFESGGIGNANGAAVHRMYSLNFETAYHVARPVFTAMNSQDSGGRIVFIGARPALDASAGKGMVAYGLSKSLLFKLADYLNASSQKVKGHVVVFSALDTPQNRQAMPQADRSQWVRPELVAQRIEDVTTEFQSNTILELV